jgi:hypothetical protein
VSETVIGAAEEEAADDVFSISRMEMLARNMNINHDALVDKIRDYVVDEQGSRDPVSYYDWKMSLQAHDGAGGKSPIFWDLVAGVGTSRRGGKFVTLDFPENETEAWVNTMHWTWTEFVMYMELIDDVSIPILLKSAFMSTEQFSIFKQYCLLLIEMGRIDLGLLAHIKRMGSDVNKTLDLVQVSAIRWLKMMFKRPLGRKYLPIETWEELFETVAVSDTETDMD